MLHTEDHTFARRSRHGSLARWLSVVLTAMSLTLAGALTVPAAAANVVVEGEVWFDGAPAANAVVSVPSADQYLRTDAQGRFAVPVSEGQPVTITFTVYRNDEPYSVTANPFAGAATNLGRVTMPALRSTTYRVVDTDGTPVSPARVWREVGLELTGDNWVDAGTPIAAGLVAASGQWRTNGGTDVDGNIVVAHPRLLEGQPLPITNVRFYRASGATWDGDMSAATGTNPVTVPIPGFQVQAPTAPTNVTAEQSFAAFPPFVRWDASENRGAVITSYTVTAQPGGHTRTVAPNEFGQSMSFTGLFDGTYTFSVVAHSAAGDSPVAASSPLTVVGTPYAPTSVTATVTAPNVIDVSWPAVPGSSIFGYQVSLNGMTQFVPAPATSVRFSNLPASMTFTATVRTVNGAGESTATTSNTVATPAIALPPAPTPEPPPLATGTPGTPRVKVNGRKVVITWTAPTDGYRPISGYKVTRTPGKTVRVSRLSRKLVIKNLKPGRYKIYVVALSPQGPSQPTAKVKFRVR